MERDLVYSIEIPQTSPNCKFSEVATGSQKWLLGQIDEEIRLFREDPRREWPDNWIIATNIDPSGKPRTGAFDSARSKVKSANPTLASRFQIWGGAKILSLLAINKDIADYYGEFITPCHVISSLYSRIVSEHASSEEIIRYLCATAFDDYQHTKLDQAGSEVDSRPGIHKLYTDLPLEWAGSGRGGLVAVDLARSAALRHSKPLSVPAGEDWERWLEDPVRSRIWFIKGGPGQGKSTSTQYIAQVNRAAIILADQGPSVTANQRQNATEIRARALKDGVWPLAPRTPVTIELRDYAKWYGARPDDDSRRMLVYLVHKLTKSIGHDVSMGDFKKSLSLERWLFIFDGLDGVPGDVKDEVADEVRYFTDNLLVGLSSDALVVCTSRPQGYSGQFEPMTRTVVELIKLSREQALECAAPVLHIGRTKAEAENAVTILREALLNSAVREIMTTPLQAHIMAVVVRNGRKPPERRWQLFNNFFDVMRRRESSRTLPNPQLSNILTRGDKLIKSLHARLGFELHARAETSDGATTSLSKPEFRQIVKKVVKELQDRDVDETVSILMEATTERLVLVNTPESGEYVRFDIRPLQEFFAAEYIYQVGLNGDLRDRLFEIARDSHWREVLHFYVSALVENDRSSELSIALEVLTSINNSALGEDSRPLSLKLALGAFQAGRILSEGVIEQDRRVRALFRNPIGPLGGCVDALSVVETSMPPHSKSWFVDLLVSTLRENSESESLGAVLLLGGLLSNDDPHVLVVRDYVLAASPEAKRCIFAVWHDRFEPWGRSSVPQWVQSLALAAVASPNWLDLDADFWRVINLIDSSSTIGSAALALGWSQELAAAVPHMMGTGRYRRRSTRRRLTPLSSIAFVETLDSDLPSIVSAWPQSVWTELAMMGGAMRGVYLALRQAQTKDAGHVAELLEWINADSRHLASLNFFLNGYVNIEGVKLPEPGMPYGKEVIRTSDVGMPRHVIIGPLSGEQDWLNALKEHPMLALQNMLYGLRVEDPSGFGDAMRTSEGRQELTRFVSGGDADGQLGHVLQTLQRFDCLNDEMRNKIVERASISEPQCEVGGPWARFDVFLPKEAGLCPYVLSNIVTDALQRLSNFAGPRRSISDPAAEASVSAYNIDYGSLHTLATDESAVSQIRLAAYILAALHPAGGTSRLENIRAALALTDAASPMWAKIGVLLAVNEGVMQAIPEYWKMASTMLDEDRENFQFKRMIEPLLRRWRERTASPVQKTLGTMQWHAPVTGAG